MKQFKHFPPESIDYVLSEIRLDDYEQTVSNICNQISEYYQRLPKFDGKKPKLIIGLSGGIDSTIVSHLATRAVGAENVITINMPAYDEDESIEKSNLVSRVLETEHYIIPIKSIVEAEVQNISKYFPINSEIETGKIRTGNYASRARVAVLYDIAREVNGKILGTGNRTEFVQGYAAKWGTPISFDFGVLDDLYKVDVYAIAEVLGVSQEIIDAVSTTGYYKGQSHEEELGATLEEQDVAAYLLFEKGMSKEAIVKEFGASADYLDSMLQRYSRSADKRAIRQEHVALRNFGGDNVQ
ncbi:MAG: NAD(+) synthase [Nanoarchaeota archaeon]|nr:NAD(+) synthase [Nanoarchaeota archaeon]MBU1622471.1 NAD(+) synthase [Nanoarchaeota archaeon]